MFVSLSVCKLFFTSKIYVYETVVPLRKHAHVINRGYLIFSVKDRLLFHRMNTKSCIFTSGEAEATSENTALFGVHSMK